MLKVEFYCNAECHIAECHNAEGHYAKCHDAECHCAECHYAECHKGEIKLYIIPIETSTIAFSIRYKVSR